MKKALIIIIQITFLTFMASTVLAGKDHDSGPGGDHDGYRMHGKHSMDFDQIRESIDWSADQLGMLNQLESSQVDVLNLVTNLRANSLDDEGEYDRSLFREQLSQNNYLLDEHKALMEDFMSTVSDEQMEQLKALRKSCNKDR